MANVIYNKFKQELLSSGVFSWTANTIKVILMSNAFTPNADTQNFYSDISANEIATGGNYTTGGQALTGKTVTRNDGTDQITITASNVVWASSTITNARYAVLFRDTGVAGTSPLIAAYDFGADKSSSNDNFTFTINASGLLVFS